MALGQKTDDCHAYYVLVYQVSAFPLDCALKNHKLIAAQLSQYVPPEDGDKTYQKFNSFKAQRKHIYRHASIERCTDIEEYNLSNPRNRIIYNIDEESVKICMFIGTKQVKYKNASPPTICSNRMIEYYQTMIYFQALYYNESSFYQTAT